MKKLFLTLTMLLFAFTGVMRASAEQGNVRDDQVIEQGFEDGLGDWTMNHCHSSSGPTSSYGGNTGNYAFRFYYTANYPQYLISPELDDNDGVNFTFYAARYSSNYPETFMVGYSSTTNDPTEFTWGSEVTCTTMYGAGEYQEYSYDFPAGTKYVSIACTSNDQFYLFVDDITVTATEPAPAPTPGEIVEVTIGDPTSTEVSSYIPGYTLYDYAISQQIYTADEIGVAGTIETLTMWLKNNSSYARNINVYMTEVEATEFASNTDWVSMSADDMVASFTFENAYNAPIEFAIPLSTPFEYSGTGNLVICFQDVTGQWSSGLGGVVMDAAGNQAIYAYRDGTVYDPSNVGVNGTLLTKKNVIRLSIMTSGGGASTAFSTIPEVLDLGYRPNGAWMAPYVFNLKSNVGAVTVNALDFSGNYFTYNAELPATVSGNNPLEVAVSTGTAEAGEVNSTITVLYSGNDRDAEQFEITAYAYDPIEGDVFEQAIEVEMEAQTEVSLTLPTEIYHNYVLPTSANEADAVYKVTFDEDAILYAGGDGNIAVYTEDFNGEEGPMDDNNYEYNGPVINPGPTALWFSYPYTGTNTWYGTSAGGGFYFGYKISTDLIAANDLAGLTITTVEAAAREAYPYYCYIIEGGATPFDGDLIGMGAIENPEALYFFDINLEVPAYISGNADIWVIFYSDSPYAAYCGRYPVDTQNGKIWTCNPNATTPQWTSNTTYAPVIYCRMLELPTGRTTTMDLAKMEVKKGNGVVSEIADAEGDVMNTPKAQLAQNRGNRNEVVIGDGTGTTYYFPIDNYFNYSVTEQIYTAAEIGTAGTINAVSFYYNYGTAYTANNVTMYMKNVARSEFASTADCEPLSASDVVWSGAIAPTEAGWYTFTLNTPFEYDGTSNLLVAFYDGTSGYPGTSYTWSQTSTGNTYMALRYYSDSTNPDPYDLASYTGSKSWYNYRGNIKIDITPAGGTPEPPTPEPFVPSFTTQFEGMVPAGTYYIVATGSTLNLAYDNVPAPEKPIIYAPYNYEANVEAPYLAEWGLGDYTVEMQVLVGTQYPPQTVLIDWTDYLVESAFLTDLEPNKNYFMQVIARNAAGETASDVVGFTTPIDPVEGFEVVEANLYPGDAAEFIWEANRSLIGYNLYMDSVLVNVDGPITGTEYAVEGLEYNMDGYEFQIAAVYGAGESAWSEPIIVKMTGTGTISGHVYDAPDYDPEDPDQSHPVANLPVFILVYDEYQQIQEYEAFTDEDGFYTAEILAGMAIPGISLATAEAYGYAVAVYRDPETGNPYLTVEYEGEYENIDIYTHEYYYPLGMITATEQPEDNNVLVEWSWNPAEMIVDFETGDFSQAEFTLPAQYPWTVTTVNPYEGTYCMKSTCEGIASASSIIEATVEVPYDAKMGFWVRVSSESNYDKFHFYIDGVEQGQALSGQAAYTYKEYNVSAGTHTYKWEYTKDSSVNSNDDCIYVDNITMYRQDIPEPPVPGATTYNFDDETMMGWTSLDANNDGYGWVSSGNPGQYHNAGVSLAGTGHNASQGYVLSGSYSNSAGVAITPDNYLVSPTQIAAQDGASISFYACAQDASYAAEHFGVAVSTSSATAANFTMVQEWTMTAKGTQGRTAESEFDIRGTRDQGNWYQYTVDLSSFAGQDIWVAIRHFNCYDEFILNVDDIVVNDGSAKPMVRSDRSLQSYNLYRWNNLDGEPDDDITPLVSGIASDVFEYIDNEWATMEYGEWMWGIQATYDGYAVEETGDRTEYTYDFEGGLNGWTGIVVNTDGGEWIHSNNNLGGYDYTTLAHGGTGFAMCYSYVDYDGAYDTDALLVSPQSYSMDANSNIHFYADNANDSYPENFSVWVSTAANPTSASDFTEVWSGGAKGTGSNGAVVRHADNRYENWREHTIDLSAYAGQTIWIAFRDVNYDAYEIWIDDVTITAGSSSPTPGPTPTPTPTGSGLSDILWSNVIDKDMEANITFNVALNNGQSPEGAEVTMVGLQNQYNATVDGEGVAELVVRKGDTYDITVSLDGYGDYTDTEFIDYDEEEFFIILQEQIGEVTGLYTSPTGWVVWEGAAGGDTPTPGPGGNTSFTEGFEGGLNGWNVLTVNADGGEWLHSSEQPYGHDYSELAHSGTGFAMCYSFVDYTGAFDTDSYLYTPQKYAIQDGSTLSFWADNANDSYPENFSVCVATADNPTAADFTQVWSGGAKGTGSDGAMVRHNNNRYENWRSHNVDLSAYAGQEVYIAFHDVNYDAYEIWIDDVELGVVNKGNRAPVSYKVMLDGTYEGETPYGYFQHNVEDMAEGSEHVTAVAPLYVTGMGEWSEYTWTYTSCEHFAGATNVAAAQDGTDVNITWTMPDAPTPVGPASEGWTENFESGMPTGWATIDADGDGYNWNLASTTMGTGYGHNGSSDMIFSQSYDNNYGVLYPDNYLVTPQLTPNAGATFSFYACAQDASYAAEHFGVFVSTGSQTSAADFTMLQEWTMSAKGSGMMAPGRDGQTRAQGTWYEKTVDLSDYAGQAIYLAIRHFNCSDMFYLDVDDVTFAPAAKKGANGNRAMWDLVDSFTGTSAGQQAVATDGNYIYTASWQTTPTGGHTFYQYDLEGNFIEGFEITGATGIRDLTTDGEYFYGTSGGEQIFVMDFTTRTLVGTINCSGLTSRHISYDPERDGFWSGNWSTLALYSRTGALIQNGPAPTSAYGSAYYKDADGVEHLFLFCQPNSDCMVYDYNITTGTLGSNVVLDFTNTAPGCTGIAGGCFIGAYDGKTCWFGNSQQDPNLIAIYELDGDAPSPTPTPGEFGIMGAYVFRNDELIAQLPANATSYTDAGADAGENSYCVRVVYDGPIDTAYYAMSCVECADIDYTCQAVTNLQGVGAIVNDTLMVTLTWDNIYDDDLDPTDVYYEVYYDETLADIVFERTCTVKFDTRDYNFSVIAVYENCASDPVYVDVVLDVEEYAEGVSIYPNPTNSNVTIEAKGMNHLTVVNSLGQVVYDADIKADMTQLNLGQYKAGIYLVRINTESGITVKRVTVVK